MPHLAAPRLFCGTFESTVFEAKNASSRATAELHIDQGFSKPSKRRRLPCISHLVGGHDPTRAMNACLNNFSAIEINTESFVRRRIENKLQFFRVGSL